MTQALAVPHVDRFGFHTVALIHPSGNTLTVFDAANEDLPQPHEVGYCRDHRTDNFIVTWVDSPDNPAFRRRYQQIVVLPGAFFRVLPHLGRNPIADLILVSTAELVALGFVVPSEDSSVPVVC
jgi:hypothetical protein